MTHQFGYTRSAFAIAGGMLVCTGAYLVGGLGAFLIALGLWLACAAANWPKGETP